MAYGDAHYDYRTIQLCDYVQGETLQVTGGEKDRVNVSPIQADFRILMGAEDRVHAEIILPGQLEAPVAAGEKTGCASLYLNDFFIGQSDFLIDDAVEKKNISFYLKNMLEWFLIK